LNQAWNFFLQNRVPGLGAAHLFHAAQAEAGTGRGQPQPLRAAERLREEQRAPFELALLVEGVHFLAMEGGVELEMAAAHREREILDPLHQEGRDAVAAMVPVDDQLVEMANRAFLPEAHLQRQRGEADHARSELGADVSLPRRQKPSPEDASESRFVEDFVRPVLAQQIENGRKVLRTTTAYRRHSASPQGPHEMRQQQVRFSEIDSHTAVATLLQYCKLRIGHEPSRRTGQVLGSAPWETEAGCSSR